MTRGIYLDSLEEGDLLVGYEGSFTCKASSCVTLCGRPCHVTPQETTKQRLMRWA